MEESKDGKNQIICYAFTSSLERRKQEKISYVPLKNKSKCSLGVSMYAVLWWKNENVKAKRKSV